MIMYVYSVGDRSIGCLHPAQSHQECSKTGNDNYGSHKNEHGFYRDSSDHESGDGCSHYSAENQA